MKICKLNEICMHNAIDMKKIDKRRCICGKSRCKILQIHHRSIEALFETGTLFYLKIIESHTF